jgi:hypothetical protein
MWGLAPVGVFKSAARSRGAIRTAPRRPACVGGCWVVAVGRLGSLWALCACLGDAGSATKDDGRSRDRGSPNLILLSCVVTLIAEDKVCEFVGCTTKSR